MTQIDINCSLCNESIEKAELSGQTVIKSELVPYWFCKSCVLTIPGINTTGYASADNSRSEFWKSFKSKLKTKKKVSA